MKTTSWALFTEDGKYVGLICADKISRIVSASGQTFHISFSFNGAILQFWGNAFDLNMRQGEKIPCF